MSIDNVVIIGAGQAGGWVAKTLRSEGYKGRIVLIGDEAHPPHERPPLSKAVMAGAAEHDSTFLIKPDELTQLDIDFRPNTLATAIDRAAHKVRCADGEDIPYDKLVLATGGRVRRLNVPGGDLPQVLYLRSIDDSLAIRAQLREGVRLLVVGGGWIGLEVAATARKKGASVTVIEATERLCIRSVPAEVSGFLADLHQREGVAVRCGVALKGFRAEGDGIVAMCGDEEIAADLVVVGIGLIPNVELAAEAGLAIDNGIVVDEQGRTSDADVFAAGDATNHPSVRLGRRVRLESWANAQNQAIVVAKALLGSDAHYDELPWFWSDQYDVNLQILGVPREWGTPVVRGDRAAGKSFSLFYCRDGLIEAVVSVNAPRDLRGAKRLMEQGKTARPEDLTNPAVQLHKL